MVTLTAFAVEMKNIGSKEPPGSTTFYQAVDSSSMGWTMMDVVMCYPGPPEPYRDYLG